MIYTTLANKILQLITGKSNSITGTGKCYLGLSSTTPNDNGGNFTEPSAATYPSYARIQLNIKEAMAYTDMFGTVAAGAVSNDKEFVSPECKEDGGWPTFTHFGIFDTPTGGTPLAGDVLRDPDGVAGADGLLPEKSMTVAKNQVAVFRIGTVQLTLK